MTHRFDIAILGGGCAGLSLAVQLAERSARELRVAVIEQREEYERDRTWCSWSVEPHAFTECVDHRWSRWSARWRGREWSQESSRFAYEHIRADRFYDRARDTLEADARFDLLMGTRVVGLASGAPGAVHTSRVQTSRGEVTADAVVDTRPPQVTSAGDRLLQHFIGWEVRTDSAVFDTTTATLMDFDVEQSGAIHFMYVLPFGPDHALVESTVLSSEVLPAEVYEERIRAYLADRHGAEVVQVDFRERGVIPMSPVADAQSLSSQEVRAGTAGGAVKPSSGYAFHAIQRTSGQLAEGLLSGNSHALAPRSALDTWMDRVFLSFLKRHPDRGPELFARMFQGTSGDTFARFMMERPRLQDRVAVVSCMPKLGFMGAALRSAIA